MPLPNLAQLQLGTNKAKSALESLYAREWSNTRQILESLLKKDTSSIESLYVLSLYFSNPGNPAFRLDTANALANSALFLYRSSDLKTKERLARFPLIEQTLIELKNDISTMAYENAMKTKTIESLSDFIRHFPDAKQIRPALLKRDSIGYEAAARKKTAAALQLYIREWPDSHLRKTAELKFDELNFQEQTKNGTAAEYESFYNRFPKSIWRNQAAEKYFFLSTIDGKEESFKNFITKFPGTEFEKLASALNKYRNSNYGQEQWLPIAERKKFGFMSFEGRMLIQPEFDSLSDETLCSQESSGLVVLPNGVYSRTGKKLIGGSFTQASALGAGFLLVANLNNYRDLIHESGWKPFNSPIKNAILIAGHFLAVKKSDKWELSALNGQLLLNPVYDSIFQIGNALIFKKSGKYNIIKKENLLAFKDGKASVKVVEEVTALGDDFLSVRLGSMEEVFNGNLENIIPLDRHSIRYSPAGFIIEKNNQLHLSDWPILKNKSFTRIDFPEPWMKTRSPGGIGLYYLQDRSEAMEFADSVWFKGRFAFAKKKDSITLFTPLKQQVTFSAGDEVKFISSLDSGLFFLVKKRTQLQLFDAITGKKVAGGTYTEINPVTQEYFIVKLKNKTGLLKRGGKQVLPADYDAILYQNGWFSLLRDKKFGGFHPESGRTLKPIYDANLISYSEELMMARKNKKWGIINLKQKPENATFLFDEVKYVNDSLALIRKSQLWAMTNVYTGEVIAERITDWQPTEGGDRIIFKSGNFYGLLSPSFGILVKPRFNEIIWLSNDHHNIYLGLMTEKDNIIPIEYMDRYGLTLQKFNTDADLIEMVLCEN